MFSRFHRYVNNKDMLGLLTNKSSTSRSSDVKKTLKMKNIGFSCLHYKIYGWTLSKMKFSGDSPLNWLTYKFIPKTLLLFYVCFRQQFLK